MRQALITFLVLAPLCCAFQPSVKADNGIDNLINKLPDISEIGVGYSAQFSGTQFLPDPNSNEMHAFVLGSQDPKKSETLEAIVRAGSRAIPFLLTHLDDTRVTKIPPIQGMQWTECPDEYDFNRRTRVDPPLGVNQKDPKIDLITHTITVGDLCFVALGQIVNRNFNATRYQPTGGLMINSPTSSKSLCDVVRTDFNDFTREKHLQLLLEDFAQPDFEGRRNGACLRLAFYYPEKVEEPVLKQLTVPSYNVFKIEAFLRQKLYPEKSVEKQKKLLADFVEKNGAAASDGIRRELFEYLDIQEADEQHNLFPPLKKKYDARSALIQLYGYKPDVKSKDEPFCSTWESAEEARFIDALVHAKSEKIDTSVYEVFLRAKDQEDDYLALACIRRLVGKSYDKVFTQYCRQRIKSGSDFAKEFKVLLKSLNPK